MHIAGFGLPSGAIHAASQFDALGSGQQSTMAGMGAGVTGVIGTTGTGMTGTGVGTGITIGLAGVTGGVGEGATRGVVTPATFLRVFVALISAVCTVFCVCLRTISC